MIRQVGSKILRHPSRDPGCLNESHEFFVRSQSGTTMRLSYLIIMAADAREDTRRSGNRSRNSATILGLGGSRRTVVINPEFGSVGLSDSPHVPRILGWATGGKRAEEMKQFLIARGFLTKGQTKPDRPRKQWRVFYASAKGLGPRLSIGDWLKRLASIAARI